MGGDEFGALLAGLEFLHGFGGTQHRHFQGQLGQRATGNGERLQQLHLIGIDGRIVLLKRL
ncbi:hypothetical protein D9M73_250680 [compost metagenome]